MDFADKLATGDGRRNELRAFRRAWQVDEYRFRTLRPPTTASKPPIRSLQASIRGRHHVAFLSAVDLLHLFDFVSCFQRRPSPRPIAAIITLVSFVIRTGGSVFHSRPSRPLAIGIVSIALLGTLLPYTYFGSLLGFVPLPASYFLFLVLVVTAYLFAVETVKRYLFRTFFV